MTDVSNLDDLAAKIASGRFPNIARYARAQAAASQSQEDELRKLREDVDMLKAKGGGGVVVGQGTLVATPVSTSQISLTGSVPNEPGIDFYQLTTSLTDYPPNDPGQGITLESGPITPGASIPTYVHGPFSPSTTAYYRLFVFKGGDLGAFNGQATATATTTAGTSPTALPTYRIHVKPNHYDPIDGAAAELRSVWVDHSSSTTSSTAPNIASLIATPDAVYSEATKKSWVWWFATELMFDTSWDPTQQGQWGSTVTNCHNCSRDVGNTGSGGIGWGFGGDVPSSFQYEYIGGDFTQHIQHRTPITVVISANMQKGVWHSALTKLTLGRIDGSVSSGGHPFGGQGRVQTWWDGSSTEIDSGACNTLNRATNPDNGITYVQTLMDVYRAGFYTKKADTIELIMAQTATRIGTTVSECLDDVPVFVSARVSNLYDGTGLNIGPSYYETLTGANQRTTATFQAPNPLPS